MKVLLFNDTHDLWHKHAAGCGPDEIAPGTRATITVCSKDVFVKVWDGMFLVRPIRDVDFGEAVGELVVESLPSE